MNSLKDLLLKWCSEASQSANSYIYRGKRTLRDIKLTNMYNYVKAQLRVTYEKYSRGVGLVANTAQGKAECCICTRPYPEYCIFPYIMSKWCFN